MYVYNNVIWSIAEYFSGSVPVIDPSWVPAQQATVRVQVYVAPCQTAGPASFQWFLECDVKSRHNQSLTRVLLPPFRLQSRVATRFWGARRVPARGQGNVRVRPGGPGLSVCFLGSFTSSDTEKRASALFFFLFPREQFLQRSTRLRRPHKPSKSGKIMRS